MEHHVTHAVHSRPRKLRVSTNEIGGQIVTLVPVLLAIGRAGTVDDLARDGAAGGRLARAGPRPRTRPGASRPAGRPRSRSCAECKQALDARRRACLACAGLPIRQLQPYRKSIREEPTVKDSMLNIRRLRVRPVVVPMRLPLQTSTGAVSMAPLVLIDLETAAGITGRAYLFAIGRPHLRRMVARRV